METDRLYRNRLPDRRLTMHTGWVRRWPLWFAAPRTRSCRWSSA